MTSKNSTSSSLPGALSSCRSLLFVPAHQERFVSKAQTRGADAIILDLEDSVPLDQKQQAREMLESDVQHLVSFGQSVCIRINPSWRLAAPDLEYAVIPGVIALVIPKVENPYQLQLIDNVVSEIETERGIAPGTIALIPMIETAAGLLASADIAKASPRVAALALGPEDLATDLGCTPTQVTMTAPCLSIHYSARAAGISALGFPDSIGNFRDEDAFRSSVGKARDMGLTGSFCIHPLQVKVLNEIFQPTKEELTWAKIVVDAYRLSVEQGKGAFSIEGKMIDAPVVQRAQQILARSPTA